MSSQPVSERIFTRTVSVIYYVALLFGYSQVSLSKNRCPRQLSANLHLYTVLMSSALLYFNVSTAFHYFYSERGILLIPLVMILVQHLLSGVQFVLVVVLFVEQCRRRGHYQQFIQKLLRLQSEVRTLYKNVKRHQWGIRRRQQWPPFRAFLGPYHVTILALGASLEVLHLYFFLDGGVMHGFSIQSYEMMVRVISGGCNACYTALFLMAYLLALLHLDAVCETLIHMIRNYEGSRSKVQQSLWHMYLVNRHMNTIFSAPIFWYCAYKFIFSMYLVILSLTSLHSIKFFMVIITYFCEIIILFNTGGRVSTRYRYACDLLATQSLYHTRRIVLRQHLLHNVVHHVHFSAYNIFPLNNQCSLTVIGTIFMYCLTAMQQKLTDYLGRSKSNLE